MLSAVSLSNVNYHLRLFEQEDLPSVFLGLSDPEVTRYYGVHYPSLEETQQQMNFYSTLLSEGTGIWWAITDAMQGEFLGAIGLNNHQTTHRKAELGYWLLKKHWGKGIIQEVAPLVIDYAFEQSHLHRLEAWVESEHARSKKLLEQLGFTCEGTLHDCEIKHGKYISLAVYALLNPKP